MANFISCKHKTTNHKNNKIISKRKMTKTKLKVGGTQPFVFLKQI